MVRRHREREALLGIACADDALDFDNGALPTCSSPRSSSAPRTTKATRTSSPSPTTTRTAAANAPHHEPERLQRDSVRVAEQHRQLRRGAPPQHGRQVLQRRRRRIEKRADQPARRVDDRECEPRRLVIDNSILFGDFSDAAFPSTPDGGQSRDFVFTTNKRNRNTDPKLAIGTPSLLKTLMPDLTPLDDSPALDADYVAQPPDNGFFEAVGLPRRRRAGPQLDPLRLGELLGQLTSGERSP